MERFRIQTKYGIETILRLHLKNRKVTHIEPLLMLVDKIYGVISCGGPLVEVLASDGGLVDQCIAMVMLVVPFWWTRVVALGLSQGF